MADKITNFEDYKKRDNEEEIDIKIEDPSIFFTEEERQEYYRQREKENESEVYDDDDERDDNDQYDEHEEYDEDEGYDEDEPEEKEGGFPIELFVRISSIITGMIILFFIALAFKEKVYDRYFARDPDQAVEVVAALPEGFTEKNDTVVVTAVNLNLRSVPSSASDATVVTTASNGTKLKRIAVNAEGTWAMVEYNGEKLYASMKYLEPVTQ